MYLPEQFEQSDTNVIHELIRNYPLATVITQHETLGVEANHVPLHLELDRGGLGRLQGHIARANPLANGLDEDMDVLAIFHGPQAYISPSWYATKAETGKVVPTWNYVAVHGYGILRKIDDPAWILGTLETLTECNESSLPEPWKVSDAPQEFTERLLSQIVGIEMEITHLTGKWKVSQNQPAVNQESVIKGLRDAGDAGATEMAALVDGYRKSK